MANIHVKLSDRLTKRIDEAVDSWGFATRAEFLRYCAIDFLKSDATALASDDVLRDHAKAINCVKAGKELAKWWRE